MLSSRWHKVLSDLISNKLRTVLIVLSIAVGLFALGTILSARALLSSGMADAYAAINPSSGFVRTVEPFDESFVRTVASVPGVAAVDARRSIEVRVLDVTGSWLNLRIFAVEDYDAMMVNVIQPESGAWPPPDREILIERSAMPLLGLTTGDVLKTKLSGDRVRLLRVAGQTHDMAQVPAQFDGSPYGYVTMETLAWFGLSHGYNELHVVADPAGDGGQDPTLHIRDVINRVKDRAERSGLTIPSTLSVEPGMVPLDDILQAVLLLMGTLGILALFLSAFLILNTVSALLAQQRRQIGVMKAIGAGTGQLMVMYLTMVMVYGLCALSIAAPLSVVGARELSRFMAGLFNFDLPEMPVPLLSFVAQTVVGLLVPVLAALYPFVTTLRITAAEAMQDFKLGKGQLGQGVIAFLLAGAHVWLARRVVRRPLLLSLRNTFRNKGRLALTLITLMLAGAIFVGVFSVRASLTETVDQLLGWWGFDVLVAFTQPYRVEQVERTAHTSPQVGAVDVWLQLPVNRVRDDGSESATTFLFAPHVGSELVPAPSIIAGRWLLPADDNAVVVNAIFLKDEPDVSVGDVVLLKIAEREEPYRVVGVCLGVMAPMVYAPYDYVARATGNAGQAGAALVRVDPELMAEADQEQALAQVTAELEQVFERHGLHVASVQTSVAEKSEAQASFGIVVALLLVMAVLLALVGGLGLMGTMSINVLERTREIGVLRAVGAPKRGVARVFILEGVIIGVLSWAFGSVLAYPLGRALGDAVGIPLMGAPLSFTYSVGGMWLWLACVVLLSALASYIPARNAGRLTVREVLAYE